MRSFLEYDYNNNFPINQVPGVPARVLKRCCSGHNRLMESEGPEPSGPGSYQWLKLDRRLASYYGAPGYYSQNARVNNLIRDLRNTDLGHPKLFVNPYDFAYGPIGNIGPWNTQPRWFRSQKGQYGIV